MNPSGFFALIGPQGSGKSKHATEIARLLGATQIVDGWDGETPIPEGSLLIVNDLQLPLVLAAYSNAHAYSSEMRLTREQLALLSEKFGADIADADTPSDREHVFSRALLVAEGFLAVNRLLDERGYLPLS